MTLNQGQQLNNRYTILSLLGQGGFGAVYKAWDNTLDVACAIKESFILSPEGQRQFLHEAQILAGLRHPNLPRVTDFFTIPEQGQYLVMDFVEGQDLEALRTQAGGRLPEAQALAWIAQVCDALSYLHRQKPPVIHRDIKPPNIRIAPPDDDYPQGRVMLVDFGIAKSFDPVMRTTIGARAVTPGFSPHEQYGQTAAVTDPRTDLYALGATLYALLTGQVPPESVLRLLRDPLIPPRKLNPAIAPQTEALILQALQNDPELRFQTAADFKTSITQALSSASSQAPALDQPVSPYSLTRLAMWHAEEAAYPPTPPPVEMLTVQPARPSPWKRIGLAFGLIAALGLLALLAGQALPAITSSPQTQTAQARASQTAQGLAALLAQQTRQVLPASLTPTPSTTPLPPSLTPSPSPVPPSPTPTSRPTRTPDLTPRVGSTQISPADGMVMSYIPAGTSLLGSSPWTDSPTWRVTLDAFWMDQTEVTNAQYAMCVAAGSCRQPWSLDSFSGSSYYAEPRYANYPVIYVDWNRASAYCTWAGRKLPTEAQWEYAARGGLAGRDFPWGDYDERMANYCDKTCGLPHAKNAISDGYSETAPVGSYPANGYRLYDMAGNVEEWVADWYGPYPSSASTNPTGPTSGEARVTRGGSWFSAFAWWLTVDIRIYRNPFESFAYLGFRCALSP